MLKLSKLQQSVGLDIYFHHSLTEQSRVLTWSKQQDQSRQFLMS